MQVKEGGGAGGLASIENEEGHLGCVGEEEEVSAGGGKGGTMRVFGGTRGRPHEGGRIGREGVWEETRVHSRPRR